MLELSRFQNLANPLQVPKTIQTFFLWSLLLPSISLIAQGIQVETNQVDQVSVLGENTYSGFASTYGVVGLTSSSNGVGVYGRSQGTQSLGMLAEGNRGLLALGDKVGILAKGDSIAISGEALTLTGIGVHGFGYLAGVIGLSTSASGIGISGQSTNGVGVEGFSGSATSYDFYAAGPGINYGAASSRRWKTDIRNINDPLEKIAALRGVYYTWDTAHGGQHDVGFIAEEVGKVLPEIVAYEENGMDAKGLDYSKLTPLLVEGFNALQREYEALKAEHKTAIKELNNRIAVLEEVIEKSR